MSDFEPSPIGGGAAIDALREEVRRYERDWLEACDSADKAEDERDALAAHVERLEGQINRAPNIDGMYGEGCRCQSCGLLYVGDLVVPDDVWEVIKPDGKPPGAGMMCASCIMSRIRCRGLWSAGYAFDAAIVGAEPAAVEAETVRAHARNVASRCRRQAQGGDA